MTKEMDMFLYSLFNVEVQSVIGAYNYVYKKLEKMDMDGNLFPSITKGAFSNISKDIKQLKRIYKGKLKMSPEDILKKYTEKDEEHYFLVCVVKLMKNSGF